MNKNNKNIIIKIIKIIIVLISFFHSKIKTIISCFVYKWKQREFNPKDSGDKYKT